MSIFVTSLDVYLSVCHRVDKTTLFYENYAYFVLVLPILGPDLASDVHKY
jgi:hypothetical protein